MTLGKSLENIYSITISLILMVMWIMGFVINGSWWNIIPFYAWYVVIEKTMNHYHFLGYIS